MDQSDQKYGQTEQRYGQRPPSLVKEILLTMLGVILMFGAFVLTFAVNIILGNIVFLFGAILTIYFTIQKYKKKAFSEQHIVSKFAIIKDSITLFEKDLNIKNLT